MNKPTTPRPTEEQVQAAIYWTLPHDEWRKLPLELKQSAHDKFKEQPSKADSYMEAARILAAALEWERYEAQEDKARLDYMEKCDCWIGVHGEFSLAARIYAGGNYPDTIRAAIDQARKEAKL